MPLNNLDKQNLESFNETRYPYLHFLGEYKNK